MNKLLLALFTLACMSVLNFQLAAAFPRIFSMDSLIPSKSSEMKESPWFCHSNPCPPYKVTKKTINYEIRDYEAGTNLCQIVN